MTGRIGYPPPKSGREALDARAADPTGGQLDLPAGGLGPEALHRLASLGLTSACLAHDMGNLLQVVAGALSLIDRSVMRAEPAGVQTLCQNARTAVDRIVTLRAQMLDLARVEPTHFQRVDPVAVISSLKGLIELTLGPDICLDINCAAGAPGVICDAQELENAILNLVVNARDAMSIGGRLSLTLECSDPCQGDGFILATPPRLILKVGDTGCGMTSDVLNRVFEPFFSTKPVGRGTGLGLPIVAEFVRRVGGTVAIESHLGEGTTVILNLPGCGQ